MESKAWVLYFKGDEQSEDLPLFTYVLLHTVHTI